MQTSINTSAKSFARAIALARSAAGTGPEAATAQSKLIAHCVKYGYVLADIVARAATAKPEAMPVAETVAKPDTSEAKADTSKRDAKREASEAALNDRRAARILAAKAVSEYYAGSSLPFKATADRFAPVRLDKAPKKPSVRQAALFASMLLAGDNVQANGTFTRGGFIIDGKRVQPETGCLSDAIGRAVAYVSGPLDGANASDAVFAFNLDTVKAEIQSLLGGALAKAALARIAALQA